MTICVPLLCFVMSVWLALLLYSLKSQEVYLYLRMWLLWNNQKMTSYFCDLYCSCCSLESCSFSAKVKNNLGVCPLIWIGSCNIPPASLIKSGQYFFVILLTNKSKPGPKNLTSSQVITLMESQVESKEVLHCLLLFWFTLFSHLL